MISLKEMNVLLPMVTTMMAISILGPAMPNLLEQKACSPWVQPPVNEFICNDTIILAEISEITVTKNVLKSVCSAFSTAAFGYWRDATGLARPLLFIGAVAEMLSTTAHLLAAIDWQSSPWVAPMMEAVISGLFGEGIFLLGANCIFIVKSDVEHRTMRLQVYMTTMLLAALVASAVGGYFLASVGYRWVLASSIMLHILTLLLCLILVEDVKTERTQIVRRSALDQLLELFKPRPNIAVVWLMLLSGSVVLSLFGAENSLATYYYQQRFHFTVKEASIYGTYHFAVAVFGSFVMAYLVTQVLKWSDIQFGMAAAFLTTLSSLSTGLANSKIILILCAPLAVMRLNLFSIPQSILSKCIKSDELGVFLGISSIFGICVMFFLNFLYNYVFSLTSKTMPGAFYFVSVGCYAFVLILFSISSCLYKPPEQLDCGRPDGCERIVTEDQEDCVNAENT
ncbi:lysosomal proton-coupled steroid conjugate and bile acid symporter SLC46A3 [Halyomorpha halys]|uniref:lysosomal proton-coupled steroid conjugate and bile acid symporter SLC46A3 n=1 Tax=Halyomorpha halys TaxID=286706 RepID=UPI0006D5140B|nr:uncharacterized protein LOC106690718 [Halyomorpha halys]XP_014291729.1 uncharacterized protein LOC106690718 [Halyomorpha halys]XP_014291731.1 uncharacterized protein LOC106690718 [Halyomorpha halys]